ncbi:hypothetical protein IBL26_24770 [Roseomonas aerophila]|uniref:Uncharacterized protein n=1 Tax=Teichococcus aerophilus TaxID=1224513 RepID=A0ABR7RU28_9PROT|nr:hypothetical protein [Pseudoroseomonas aerophila]MBC9210062.1 hypothetical protein [Pseudoroseomonas aerophila]
MNPILLSNANPWSFTLLFLTAASFFVLPPALLVATNQRPGAWLKLVAGSLALGAFYGTLPAIIRSTSLGIYAADLAVPLVLLCLPACVLLGSSRISLLRLWSKAAQSNLPWAARILAAIALMVGAWGAFILLLIAGIGR